MAIHLPILHKKKDRVQKSAEHCPESKAALQEYVSGNIYPEHYEKKVITRAGIELFMRPIRPEDASLLLDLINSLSPKSKYYRFFTPLEELPRHLLIRFTQIDYNRDMALVALDKTESEERMLAVARFFSKPNQPDTEFAVVVRDEWQGKGVGRVLLENLIVFARDKKIESMSGFVLTENIHMLSLARKLGFQLSKIPGEDQYIIKTIP
ncbi:MAG: GNAT family N-acetyltransferase [Desulfobacteraceae bacterium]|jgi:acetyltransferase